MKNGDLFVNVLSMFRDTIFHTGRAENQTIHAPVGKGIIAYCLILFTVIVLPGNAEAGCAEILDIRINVNEISSGKPYSCEVQVDSGSSGSRTIACGVSFNGGYPMDFCPSDQFFQGWSGSTARFNCIFPNTRIAGETDTVEMVGWDFDSGCDVANGKRKRVTLVRVDTESPDPEGTPSGRKEDENNQTEDPDTVENQQSAARKLLRSMKNMFAPFYPENEREDRDIPAESGTLFDPTRSPQATSAPAEPGTGRGMFEITPSPGNQSTPAVPQSPVSGSCANHRHDYMKYTCGVYEEIQQACGGQVQPENRLCLNNVRSLTPNARANMIRNAQMNYCSGQICSRGLQCMGWAQGIFAAVMGDLTDTQNPFMGVNWPREAVGNARIANHFNWLPYTQCRQQVPVGTPLWLIWGSHIGIAEFASENREYYTLYHGNTNYLGKLGRDHISATVATSMGHPMGCLVPKRL